MEERGHEVEGVPDWRAAKDDHGGRGHNDAYEGCNGEPDGNGEELRPEGG